MVWYPYAHEGIDVSVLSARTKMLREDEDVDVDVQEQESGGSASQVVNDHPDPGCRAAHQVRFIGATQWSH